MNYPIWHLPSTGGGLLIAIIAIAHVVISHLAVGGGLFLVLTERKAHHDKDKNLLAYVKSHTWFFVLLTMVFGGVSGVGIWFIIALVNPAATSMLIHNFVFGWAIEWVFFIGEIVALLIYYYRFEKMSPKNHMILGWLYFIFAWLSLFIINGILGFMLTPGRWMETGNFWLGFFNPSFLPSLIFRTCIALIFAGVFGLITGSFRKEEHQRQKILMYCAKWMYYPMLVLVLAAIYYTQVISDDAFENLFHFNVDGSRWLTVLIVSSVLLFVLGFGTLFKMPKLAQRVGAFVLVIIAFGWMAGFEYMREIARKPYVLYENMYSNGISPEQIENLNETGFLSQARWAIEKEVTGDNMLKAGEELFLLQCHACHTIDGYKSVKGRTELLTERGIEAQLTGQGRVNTYMPPFAGTVAERKALAAYLAQEIHGRTPIVKEKYQATEELPEIPDFNTKTADYVLLAWNDLGMHCISDNEKYWSFLPPANALYAQLVKRGEKPEVVTEGIKIEFEVEKGYENPEDHSMFWEYDKSIFGVDLPEGQGLSGHYVNGEMHRHETHFTAHHIPVVPYRDDNTFNPYPIFTVRAVLESTGEVIAETGVVAPTSTEMGCRNCHGGGWRVNNTAGVADETAINILKAHDRMNGTTLLEDAENGHPRLCQSCHEDPAVGSPGKPGVLNFSAAIHGFHANYLTGLDEESCNLCHPSHSDGNTVCFRGRHTTNQLHCTECHGKLEDHALGLLKYEMDNYRESSFRMAKNLEPRMAADFKSVNARKPWMMEPDCRTCHRNFDIKTDGYLGNSFNKWGDGGNMLYRNRSDQMGMMCAACHGSPHALYPAMNIYGDARDNIQPLQYQNVAGPIGINDNCAVCHKKNMPYNGHHRNMKLNMLNDL